MSCKFKSGKIARVFLLIIFSLFILSFSFAEENSTWTIGAMAFTFTQDVKRSEYEKSILKAVPQLILEQLQGLNTRNVPADEILDRKVNELIKERLGLFLELSKESKVRDSFVLKDLSEYQYNKNIKQSEKKILEIQRKIDDNLIAQDKLYEEIKNIKPKEESFSLYKNEATTLYESKEENLNRDYFSYSFSNDVVKANINGLITGSIVTYGSYAAVSAEMIIYPGAKSTGVITEIGNISNIESIAKNIAYRLIPYIENSVPCEVIIKLKDESLRKKSKLTVDSTIYSPVPEKLILGSGVHNLTFECENFRKESFSYGFGYEKKYVIEINFVESSPIETSFNLLNPVNGSVFYNGEQSDDNSLSVRINNQGVLGYYFSSGGNSLYFMIPKKLLVDKTSVDLKLKDIDVGVNIEKRRKMMYISYSALVCSLPYLLYSYSTYNSMSQSYSSGNVNISQKDIQTYQTMSTIGIGISAGMGVWFTVELVRYLIAANKALPVEAKKSSVSYEQSLQDFKKMQDMFFAIEEEERKRQQLENAQKELENSPQETDSEIQSDSQNQQ